MKLLFNTLYAMYLGFILSVYEIHYNDIRFYIIVIPIIFFVTFFFKG